MIIEEIDSLAKWLAEAPDENEKLTGSFRNNDFTGTTLHYDLNGVLSAHDIDDDLFGCMKLLYEEELTKDSSIANFAKLLGFIRRKLVINEFIDETASE